MQSNKNVSKNFWLALIVFSLAGQIAWVVENMYLNVFIYNIFAATEKDISLMVALSAVSATLTSIFIGALSDKIGKRKLFICGGYILWGVSILCFSLIRLDVIDSLVPMAVSSATVGITLVIIMDCVMTFFGSSANDAAFNAWLTDSTNDKNRGTAEGLNAMMPLVAILVVFGGFMAFDLKQAQSWTTIFVIIGVLVIAIGVLGLFIIKEPKIEKDKSNYFKNIIYGFLPSTIKENGKLYLSLIAFIIFNISIQIFMPYLIIYYEVSLKMSDYVLIMAPAIIIASVVTALWGKVYDKKGFAFSSAFSIIWLVVGYILLYLFRGKLLVFIGSLLMMSGYLSGMAVFGAKIRANTPVGKAGRLQGVRIVAQVLVPGLVGPYIGQLVLANAEKILIDGVMKFVPNANIFLAALIVILVLIPFIILFLNKDGVIINDLETPYEVGETPFNEYPRPQIKRQSFINLNGKWLFKVVKKSKTLYDGEILVPFCPESKLSTVKRVTKKGETLIYERTFNVKKQDLTTLLNFGAVDRHCEVFINDNKVGENDNGYIPFTFDITPYLIDGENKITVKVTDETSIDYAYGKQKIKRGGMWYTPVSGIWQTVWLEQVAPCYIKSLKITPTLNSVTIETTGGEEEKTIILNGEEYKYNGDKITINIKGAICWTPENPHLYNFELISGNDKISSYFALRQVEIKDGKILLNGEPYFFHGLLDQGYYPDGIFLPGNEQGFKDDVLNMKSLGFNTLRKHIKIEPMIYYYYCDKYGMVVFQDFINNGKYSFVFDTVLPTIGYKKKRLVKVSKKQQEVFKDTALKTMQTLYNTPAIVYYTIFNEGWGQFDGTKVYNEIKKIDATRIYDTASGWFNDVESDVQSEHVYFKPLNLKTESDKPLVLSEFGGYSYKINENSFNLSNTYGYKKCTEQTFMNDIESLYYNQVIPSIKNNLCASILTQVSDVEDETNGLITYDRKVIKIDKEKMQKIANEIFDVFSQTCKK